MNLRLQRWERIEDVLPPTGGRKHRRPGQLERWSSNLQRNVHNHEQMRADRPTDPFGDLHSCHINDAEIVAIMPMNCGDLSIHGPETGRFVFRWRR
jgi:hypothetical protein